jgi:hypothetical protein
VLESYVVSQFTFACFLKEDVISASSVVR